MRSPLKSTTLAFCLAALAAAPAQSQAIEPVPYADLETELTTRIDFESYPKILSPGQPLDTIEVFDGAQFAERFRGQLLTQTAGFDDLFALPVSPLTLQPGQPGQNLAVMFIFYMSNQLKGMAPPGFPAEHAGGEGAVSILFDRDQSALGFRVTSEPAPRDATTPKGQMTVAFYRRDGFLLDTLQVDLDWVLGSYGFSRSNGARDIAGISITNRDPAGVSIDDVIFDRDVVVSWLIP